MRTIAGIVIGLILGSAGVATAQQIIEATQGQGGLKGPWSMQGRSAAATLLATAGNPVLVGGSDGTRSRTIRTDTSGYLLVGFIASTTTLTVLQGAGASATSSPWHIDDSGSSLTVDGTVTSNQGTAGSTSTPWHIDDSEGSLTVDGRVYCEGLQASGTSSADSNPVKIAGQDSGGTKRTILTEALGQALVELVDATTTPFGTSVNPFYAIVSGTVTQGGSSGTSTTWYVNPAAQTSSVMTEVLTGTSSTAVPSSALTGRRSIEIQNLGPNPIFCRCDGTAPVVNKARRIEATNGAWSIDCSEACACKCITSADQVTGAATIATEIK